MKNLDVKEMKAVEGGLGLGIAMIEAAITVVANEVEEGIKNGIEKLDNLVNGIEQSS